MLQNFFLPFGFQMKTSVFSLNEHFYVSPFSTQPTSASVNCVNSYKIYTMFNNNFPFKLNFSKWNRISLRLDHRARIFFSFSIAKYHACFFPLLLIFVQMCVCDSKLSSEFFFRSRNAQKYFYELFKIAYSSCGQWHFFWRKIFHLHLKWRWITAGKKRTTHRVISLLIIMKQNENKKKTTTTTEC